MDINELYTVENHDKGAEMQVKTDLGEKLDMYFTIIGVDSKKWRGLQTKLKGVNGTNEDLTPEAELLSEAVIGWRGVESKGKEMPYSKDSVKDLLINAPYLMNQIIAFVLTRSNFTKG